MHDITRVETAFDRAALKRICEMHERDFADAFDLTTVVIDDPRQFPTSENYYYFKDNGADVLAVAHLDTVVASDLRLCNFVETAAGEVVHSGALDDRLGAYIILELLPALGIKYDILLTVGEESGNSTASAFSPEKEYNYMIEFDRGGTDVVMYDYEDENTRQVVKATGARVGHGSFSDISYLEHLEIKGWNWGVGYQDYHGPRSHAYLDDTFKMVAHYLRFHRTNHETYFPHERRLSQRDWWSSRYDWDAENDDSFVTGIVDEDEQFDEDGIYFDREYVENPTPEQLRAAAERMLW